jgi:hypothetical protein
MTEMAGITGLASRACPTCGGGAAIHARVRRAMYDWEITFVECLRLRCCDRTFTSTPAGLTPRARYSDRVVALARALVSSGVSMRCCVRLFSAAGVPVTLQTIRTWCACVEALTVSTARIASDADGEVAVRLRDALWIAIQTRRPRLVLALLNGSRKPCEATR